MEGFESYAESPFGLPAKTNIPFHLLQQRATQFIYSIL